MQRFTGNNPLQGGRAKQQRGKKRGGNGVERSARSGMGRAMERNGASDGAEGGADPISGRSPGEGERTTEAELRTR